ncbi:MAG: Transket pyr protein [Actinomycetota bacterium]|nr:Transket pyr protein [Actinomycetota bacterium]
MITPMTENVDEPETLPSLHDLEIIAAGMRAWVLAANKHPGGTASMVEAMTALYFSGATRLDGTRAGDRLIYSKGHAVAPWYFALWARGTITGTTWRDLAGFGQVGHPVPRMPRRDITQGVEMSTGALGQGLSFGAGTALADRRNGSRRRTFVVLGDGECTEGQVWEAAMTAARLGLANLVAVIDANGTGSVIALPRKEWAPRWTAFGWRTVEVDGHDLPAVVEALQAVNHDARPTAIILRTVKGKGLDPAVEDSVTLSAEAAAEHIPELDFDTLINETLVIVERHWPSTRARRIRPNLAKTAPRVVPDRDTLYALISDHPVGSSPIAKKSLAGELAEELSSLPMLWAAPDAIRNSGLLDRMHKVGSWQWDNPSSDVLQCAIAEQDAASLIAGAASAGLIPVLCSMEGFYWRMLDQIRQSIAFPGLPVLLVGTSGGIGDPLGPMVQSDGCLTALTAIPHLEIFEASDVNTAKVLAIEAISSGRPAYLRLPHEGVPVRHEIRDLATRPLQEGSWTLLDDPDPQVVIVTAGDLRETALATSDRLVKERGQRVRVLEIISPTRFARLPRARRDVIIPSTAVTASIHNAPSTVLGSFLPDGGISIGVDGYGIAGSPLELLYQEAGLTCQALFDRISGALR